MKIRELTERESDLCKGRCGFTRDEWDYFVLKRNGFGNVVIAMEMNVSVRTVERLSNSVKKKINKVL